MRVASNVVVHNPEADLGKIGADRLRAHGWPDEVVQQQQQREQASHDIATPAPAARAE